MRRNFLDVTMRTLVAVALASSIAQAQGPDRQASAPASPVAVRLETLRTSESQEARVRAAGEILASGDHAARATLSDLLRTGDPRVREAITNALAERSESIAPEHVALLAAMLPSDQGGLRQAATAALIAAPGDSALAALGAFVRDANQPLNSRLQIVQALGNEASRRTTAALVELLAVDVDVVRDAALTSIERATGLTFEGDAAAAQEWWARTRDQSDEEWSDQQRRRLTAAAGRLREQASSLQARLDRALRASFQRAAEDERPALLTAHLTDSLDAVRLLGLELIQEQQAAGAEVGESIRDAVRPLLADASPEVRAAAVRVVIGFRAPADADRFLAMLDGESSPAVRIALVNGLGYVGEPSCVVAVLARLSSDDRRLQAEALTALGRLAERKKIAEGDYEAVTQALLNVFKASGSDKPLLRERALWAMGRLADKRFGPVFVNALDAAEAVSVRQAAIRGLASIDASSQVAALARLVGDADVIVRRQAVELVAKWATSSAPDSVLEALFGRLAASQEPEEAIRKAAWEGVQRMLDGRSAAEIDAWVKRLPEENGDLDRRTVALLELEVRWLDSHDAPPTERGAAYLRAARVNKKLEKSAEAVRCLTEALINTHRAQSADTDGVAAELLCYALTTQRYNKALAETMYGLTPALDGTVLWAAAHEELERRRNENKLDEVRAMLEALQSPPTPSWPTDAVDAYRRSVTPPTE